MIIVKRHIVFLLIGGNIEDRLSFIRETSILLSERAGNVIKQSQVYETEAWGFTTENNFLNCALQLSTTLAPEELLKVCQHIELELGRVREEGKEGYQSRTVDIDIIFYDSLIVDLPVLKIPHPLLQERLFVLKPLAEIAPNYVHPIFGSSIKQLLSDCKDASTVKLFVK